MPKLIDDGIIRDMTSEEQIQFDADKNTISANAENTIEFAWQNSKIQISNLVADNTANKAITNASMVNNGSDPLTASYVEETKVTSGSIYFTIPVLQIGQPFISSSFAAISTAFSTRIVTSPLGYASCFRLDHGEILAYNLSAGTFAILTQYTVNRNTQIVLAYCTNGNLVEGVVFDTWTRTKRAENDRRFALLYDGDLECLSLAERVKSNQKYTNYTFTLTSDSHVAFTNVSTKVIMASVSKCLSMGSYCKINLNVIGGDVITHGAYAKTVPLATHSNYVAATRSVTKTPTARTRGNHDDGCYATATTSQNTITNIITPHELFMNVDIYNSESLVIDSANPEGGYGYRDDPISKIRMFVLNTLDYPLIVNGDGLTYKYTGYNFSGFQNAQLNFFASALLSTPSDYGIAIFSHIPPETTKTDGVRFGITDSTMVNANIFFGILNAFKVGTSYASESATGDTPHSVTVDFTSRGAGEVIVLVCGHVPFDNTSNAVGGVGAPEYGYRFISIDGGSRFAIFDVDRSTKTIRVYKYGGANVGNPAMAHPPIIGLLAADVNVYGDFTTTYA